VFVTATEAKFWLYLPIPSGVRVRNPNRLLGLREGALVTPLIVTPKLLATAVVERVTDTVFPVTTQARYAPLRPSQVELLLGEISTGKITSRNDEGDNGDCCERVKV